MVDRDDGETGPDRPGGPGVETEERIWHITMQTCQSPVDVCKAYH